MKLLQSKKQERTSISSDTRAPLALQDWPQVENTSLLCFVGDHISTNRLNTTVSSRPPCPRVLQLGHRSQIHPMQITHNLFLSSPYRYRSHPTGPSHSLLPAPEFWVHLLLFLTFCPIRGTAHKPGQSDRGSHSVPFPGIFSQFLKITPLSPLFPPAADKVRSENPDKLDRLQSLYQDHQLPRRQRAT